MKPRIRLGFSDFWPGFDHCKNFFTRLLGERFELELSERPDYLIYSCVGEQFRRHQGIRIYYTGENLRPDFTQCDYAFTFDYCDHPNHMRLPHWRFRSAAYQPPNKQHLDLRAVLAEKTKFCNFVYSNKYCHFRNRFFRKLSQYKPIDSAGKLFNNVGGRIGRTVAEKLEFIRPYKFTIAFENESHPGYTTEKIYEPMLVNSLPIYWGDPWVHRDFNPASFLSFYDYDSQDALIERVIEVDQNDELYNRYLAQPWFPPGADEQSEREKLLAQFERIFFAAKMPVAQEPKSLRYYIIHPPRRASTKLGQKTLRLGRKIRYQLDLARSFAAARRS